MVEVYNAMNKEYDELKEIGGTVIKISAENSGSLNPIQQETVLETINEQIQNIAQKKDTLCRMMYN